MLLAKEPMFRHNTYAHICIYAYIHMYIYIYIFVSICIHRHIHMDIYEYRYVMFYMHLSLSLSLFLPGPHVEGVAISGSNVSVDARPFLWFSRDEVLLSKLHIELTPFFWET